jgi:polysaccharidase protein
MTVYYVNSVTGSNHNTGASKSSAFKTLSAVESLKLKPGDSVLLAAGSVFNEQFDLKHSGSVSAPIKIGSYGTGAAPVIHSGADGIHSSHVSNLVIENIKISHIGGAAIYAANASNWTVRHVTVDNTGLSGKPGSVIFQNGQNITIENSKISGVHGGDGIWMQKVNGVHLVNNTVKNSHGSTADAVQLNDSHNILIRGNHLDQTDANSPKGVLALVRAEKAVIEDNTLVGGGFGVSAEAGKNIVIRDNDISGFSGYSWSYAIGLGDKGTTRDYDISGNYIHDGAWGVAISAAGNPKYAREDINIHNNVFDDLTHAALKLDRPASGSFHNNVIERGVKATSISPDIIAAHTFPVSGNTTVKNAEAALAAHDSPAAASATKAAADPAVVAVHDNLKILSDTGEAHHGNLLKNDSSDNGTLVLRRFGDETVGKHGLTLTGKYGDIQVDREGNYAYTLDDTKLAGHSGHVSESFSYGINDGTSHHSDTDALTVFIHLDGLLS